MRDAPMVADRTVGVDMGTKLDRVVVYVPAEMPGANVIARTRYVIALAFAELRDGMDAEPTADDHAMAAHFWITGPIHTTRVAGVVEDRVTVTADAARVRAYRAALRAIA